MASLTLLPAPLPLLITKGLPDLIALEALRRSCTLFDQVFALNAVEILESVICSLHQDLAFEVRAHVILLSNGSRWQTTDGLQRLHAISRGGALTKGAVTVAAVSLALQTFSHLYSLTTSVAAKTLQKLYALPHRHPNPDGPDHGQFTSHEGTAYDIPAHPTPLDWIEEQRILLAICRLRTGGLLGMSTKQIEDWTYVDLVAEAAIAAALAAAEAARQARIAAAGGIDYDEDQGCNGIPPWTPEKFSVVREVRPLFVDDLDVIMRAPVLPQQGKAQPVWLAPASMPLQDRPEHIDSYYSEPTADYPGKRSSPSTGWGAFHYDCNWYVQYRRSRGRGSQAILVKEDCKRHPGTQTSSAHAPSDMFFWKTAKTVYRRTGHRCSIGLLETSEHLLTPLLIF